MEKSRRSRIYGLVAIIVAVGLCLSIALGAVTAGFVGNYLIARQGRATESIQIAPPAQRLAEPTPEVQIVATPERPPATPDTTVLELEAKVEALLERVESLAAAQETGALDIEVRFEEIYDQVNPSVVNINVAVRGQRISPFGPFADPDIPDYQFGTGSGFVYDREGHIVTNNHVVEDAERITVTFADDTVVEATLVGQDPDSDLAVIKVDPQGLDLIPVELGDSDALRVGQTVVAIGNPFGFAGTLTTGVISGLGRSLPSTGDRTRGTYTIPDVVQTDAAINPGNSGGPLLDIEGRVIGVNAAIQSPVQGSSGVGFAIPVHLVKLIVPSLIDEGEFTYPYLGISGGTLYPEAAEAMNLSRTQRGALVVTVSPDGPADRAGLRPSTRQITVDGNRLPVGGDVIVAIGGHPVAKFDDLLIQLIRNHRPGDNAQITVLRDGRTVTLTVTLGERPTQ